MNGLAAWFATQLASPSTHNALAVVAGVLTQQAILPPPYGLIATGVFAALGILVPEQGEKP